MSEREAWLATVQHGDGDHEQDEELVTIEGGTMRPGATLELTNGTRITLTAPAEAA